MNDSVATSPGPAPRVSMVMPVYNGAQYLDAALRSIREQSFRDFELICVDDGSTDATATILAAHAAADARIRLAPNPHNLGLPATLNRGFAVARGAYHSWTSHDNLLRPQMLTRLVAALDAAPTLDIVYAGYSVIDADDRVLRYVAPRPISERWFTNPVGAAFLYRRAVTDGLGGYDEALFGAEDYDFWFRAARRFRMEPLAEDLYLYRRHGDSLTDQRVASIKQMVVDLLLRELADMPDKRLRARATLALVLNDHRQLRWPLLRRAAADSSAELLRASPRLARHAASVVAARLRPAS